MLKIVMKEILRSPAAKYIIVAIAIIWLILLDPFSDEFAFWLLAKTGISISYESLSKWLKLSLVFVIFGLAFLVLSTTTFAVS